MKKSIMLISVLAVISSPAIAEDASCNAADRPIVVASDTGDKTALRTNTASGWCRYSDRGIDNAAFIQDGGDNGGEAASEAGGGDTGGDTGGSGEGSGGEK